MRTVTFYLAVWIAALVSCAMVQMGWRPSFIGLWDSRARVYAGITCFLLAFLAALALSTLVAVTQWPARLRAMPSALAMSLTSFTFMGVFDLAPTSTLNENLAALARSSGYGLAVGLAIGFIGSFEQWPKHKPGAVAPPSRLQRTAVLLMSAVSVVGLALLLTPRARDDAKVNVFDRIAGANGDLEIGISKGAFADNQFGVVQITSLGARNALILEPDEWKHFVDLAARAERSQSPSWRAIGVDQDSGPGEITNITVSAGPGVRLVTSAPHRSTVAYDVAPKDFARFNTAIGRVDESLHR